MMKIERIAKDLYQGGHLNDEEYVALCAAVDECRIVDLSLGINSLKQPEHQLRSTPRCDEWEARNKPVNWMEPYCSIRAGMESALVLARQLEVELWTAKRPTSRYHDVTEFYNEVQS